LTSITGLQFSQDVAFICLFQDQAQQRQIYYSLLLGHKATTASFKWYKNSRGGNALYFKTDDLSLSASELSI
jgi:hypothetical protein